MQDLPRSEEAPKEPFPKDSSPIHGDTNVVKIGDNASVEQIAVGTGITQIKGYTAEQVSVLITSIGESFQPRPFDGRSPYVGLASFQEQDAGRFFGRERVTQELVARVAELRLLVIAGPSGSGKSSVARAGVIPALKRGALKDSERLKQSEHWLYETMAPGRQPLAQLGRVVASWTGRLTAGDEVAQQGKKDATLLARWAEIALGDQRTRRAVLLIDQFEELFTQVTDESERAAFLNLLTYAATVEGGRVTVVCCTRSDFIGNWAAYPSLNAQLSRGFHQIPPMQPDELVNAIARPALEVGLKIDPELVKQILDDMRDAPGALPLMQFALDDLFEYEKSKGGVIALTRDDYLERGGLQKALARHADAQFAQLSAEEQQIARTVFAGLIEPGRGTVDTKRTALFEELVPAGSDVLKAQTVVTKLADARLITTDNVNDHETVTLAHERLIDAWSWLRKLVDENREAITLQNGIGEDAKEWAEHGRDASYLYAGARLATAREQLKAKKIVLSASAQQFVDAAVSAREAERQREQRRTRVTIAGLAIGLLAIGALAVFAFVQWRETLAQRNLLLSRQLASTALSQMRVDTQRSLLLAMQAMKFADTPEAQAALRQILAASNAYSFEVESIRDTPEGQAVSIACAAGDANCARARGVALGDKTEVVIRGAPKSPGELEYQFVQVLTGKCQAPGFTCDVSLQYADRNTKQELSAIDLGFLEDHRTVFSPVDKRVLTVTICKENFEVCRSRVQIWDLANGNELVRMENPSGSFVDARWSPDGKYIATLARTTEETSQRAIFQLWDAGSGTLVRTLYEGLYAYNENDAVAAFGFFPHASKIWIRKVERPVNFGVDIYAVETEQKWLGVATTPDVTALEISSDGTLGVVVDANGSRVWEIDSGKVLYSVSEALYFSYDGQYVLGPVANKGFRVRLARSGEFIRDLIGGSRPQVTTSGQTFAALDAQNHVLVWAANAQSEPVIVPYEDEIKISRDGARIMSDDDLPPTLEAAGPQIHNIFVWNGATGEKLATFGHFNVSTQCLALSPDGKLGAVGTSHYSYVWDVETNKLLLKLGGDGDAERAECPYFSRDGTHIATNAGNNQGHYFELPGGTLLHSEFNYSPRFSPDGKYLASASNRTVVYEAATGKNLYEVDARFMRYSADSKILVTRKDAWLHFLDSGTGAEQFEYHIGQPQLYGYDLSSDVARIVLAAGDEAQVWNVRTNTLELSLKGHAGKVLGEIFSPDDQWIATLGEDETVRLWNAKTGKLLSVIREISITANLEFSGDSQKLLISQHGQGQRYAVAGTALMDVAQMYLTRDLDCAERVEYLQEALACPTPTPTITPTITGTPTSTPTLVPTETPSPQEQFVKDARVALVEAQAALLAGDTNGAAQAYGTALRLADQSGNGSVNNSVCWFGSIDGFAALVLPACERAVALEPKNIGYVDSRGIARALTGDTKGAIEDFKAFVEWTKTEEGKQFAEYAAERERWIATLEAGGNPFDAETLKKLRDE